MAWITFDEGASIGQCGSENGVILRDEEHSLGARLTLERDGSIAPLSITCGVYGWMFHTRFLSSYEKAEADYEPMKEGLSDILDIIPLKTDPNADKKMAAVSNAISCFVERFP